MWKGRLPVRECVEPECFLGVGGAGCVAGGGVDEEGGGFGCRFRGGRIVGGGGEQGFCDADKGFLFFLVGAGAESELDVLRVVTGILPGGQRGLRGARSDGNIREFGKVCTFWRWRSRR